MLRLRGGGAGAAWVGRGDGEMSPVGYWHAAAGGNLKTANANMGSPCKAGLRKPRAASGESGIFHASELLHSAAHREKAFTT